MMELSHIKDYVERRIEERGGGKKMTGPSKKQKNRGRSKNQILHYYVQNNGHHEITLNMYGRKMTSIGVASYK